MAKISEFLPNQEHFEMQEIGFGEKITCSNRSSDIPKDIERTDNDDIIVKIDFQTRNFENNVADDIAKKLLENKLAISLCQNLSYYSASNNLARSSDGPGKCPCPPLPAR